MAHIYTRTCDICSGKALQRDSHYIGPASSSKRYLVCGKCGRTLATFMKKHGLLKSMHPKVTGSQERKLRTRKRK